MQLLLFNLLFRYFYVDIRNNNSQHFFNRIDLQCLIIRVIDDDNINNAIVRLLETNNSIDNLLIELYIRWDIHKNDIWTIFLKVENCEWDLKWNYKNLNRIEFVVESENGEFSLKSFMFYSNAENIEIDQHYQYFNHSENNRSIAK